MSGAAPTPEATAARVRRILASAVLVAEAFVVWFALLAAVPLTDLDRRTVLVLGIGTAVACVLCAGLLRGPAGYVLGSLLQVVLVAAGFVVPAMFAVGGLFALLWVGALVLATRVEAAQRRLLEQGGDRDGDDGGDDDAGDGAPAAGRPPG